MHLQETTVEGPSQSPGPASAGSPHPTEWDLLALGTPPPSSATSLTCCATHSRPKSLWRVPRP